MGSSGPPPPVCDLATGLSEMIRSEVTLTSPSLRVSLIHLQQITGNGRNHHNTLLMTE
jgi:hypothetical protein